MFLFLFQTADEYLVEYNRRRGNEYSRFHGYTYDGIWAVALAIQYVVQKKEQISNFQYRVKEWESIFLEALKNTSFEGVTVNIYLYIYVIQHFISHVVVAQYPTRVAKSGFKTVSKRSNKLLYKILTQ